jgi:hypothetical protein
MLTPPPIGVAISLVMSDRKALARQIAARSKPRFVEIQKQLKRPHHTEEELAAIRGGRTEEEYRWYLIRTFLKD